MDGTPGQLRVRMLLSAAGVILFAVLALIVVPSVAYRQVGYGLQSPDWPTTNGCVATSGVQSVSGSQGLYEPSIEYEYRVEGQILTGNTYRFHGVQTDINRAQAIASGYRPGAALQVHYKPNEPAISVINPGIRIGEIIEATIAFIVGDIALLIVLALFAFDYHKCASRLSARTG